MSLSTCAMIVFFGGYFIEGLKTHVFDSGDNVAIVMALAALVIALILIFEGFVFLNKRRGAVAQ